MLALTFLLITHVSFLQTVITGTLLTEAEKFYYEGCADQEDAKFDQEPFTCEDAVALTRMDGSEYRYPLVTELQAEAGVSSQSFADYAVLTYRNNEGVLEETGFNDLGTKLLATVQIEYGAPGGNRRRRLLTLEGLQQEAQVCASTCDCLTRPSTHAHAHEHEHTHRRTEVWLRPCGRLRMPVNCSRKAAAVRQTMSFSFFLFCFFLVSFFIVLLCKKLREIDCTHRWKPADDCFVRRPCPGCRSGPGRRPHWYVHVHVFVSVRVNV